MTLESFDPRARSKSVTPTGSSVLFQHSRHIFAWAAPTLVLPRGTPCCCAWPLDVAPRLTRAPLTAAHLLAARKRPLDSCLHVADEM